MAEITSKPGSLQREWAISCPLHASAYALYMNLHSHRVLPPIRPIEGSGRFCRSVAGFVGLCKRPRKMFSDKLFRIPQSLLGRASYHAAWCITRSRCLFPSLPVSPPSFPPFLNHSFRCPFSPLCLCSLSLSYPTTLSFTLPEMDPVLGQAVSDNGGN